MSLEQYDVDDTSGGTLDFLPPSIPAVGSQLSGGSATFYVHAEDNTSVKRVLVTYDTPDGNGGGSWHSVDLSFEPPPYQNSGLWIGSVSGLNASTHYFASAGHRRKRLGRLQ
jgi:hypothetical protein